jgi:hypothetical protein
LPLPGSLALAPIDDFEVPGRNVRLEFVVVHPDSSHCETQGRRHAPNTLPCYLLMTDRSGSAHPPDRLTRQ